ncbi:major facilitator superfamily MFS_1 [Magnetococcus marinus MC-1]|uniref:Major facilitator superfamily MFS_1 n=1 Tax=Magnetococcus marinus (strain ATCC BAA-1437 / JCM 17883 / MC-1) TaxID=156889 RepID=A0LC41_MAGMM|nr:YbfB/YjiJ family MFS transporter [Magnetococcus marinus]ABK45534.1 major facilitator superfamily MFS_1 [Magnetococcus marinus MC-1]
MPQPTLLQALLAGIASIVLTLGIARFAYTPLLPLMQQQAGLSLAGGGELAAFNYLGYLSGALVAALINDLYLKDRLFRLGLLVALLSTLGMGLTQELWIWSLLRYLAGLSSAAGLLLGTGLLLNWLLRQNHKSELGLHFSGVGLGIFLGAAVVAWADPWLNWQQQWWLLTALGVVLALLTLRWFPHPDANPYSTSGTRLQDNPPTPLFMALFQAAYFCAGIGYVVSATFIVAVMEALPAQQGYGNSAFLILGLAAAPACLLWDRVARVMGEIPALILASLLQVLGIVLPLWLDGLFWALLGAVLFGGTFIGIVSLVLTMAGHYYPTRPARMMGRMTLSYGVAQIIGPALTGWIATSSGNYRAGLYLAAAMMLLGTLLLLILQQVDRHQQAAPTN